MPSSKSPENLRRKPLPQNYYLRSRTGSYEQPHDDRDSMSKRELSKSQENLDDWSEDETNAKEEEKEEFPANLSHVSNENLTHLHASPVTRRHKKSEKEYSPSSDVCDVPENIKGKGQNSCLYFGLVVLIGAILVFWVYYSKNEPEPKRPADNDISAIFKNKMKYFKQTFPSQNSVTWNSIYAAILPQLLNRESPDRPAIILMAVPRFGAKESAFALCLAKQLVSDFNELCNATVRTPAKIDIVEDIRNIALEQQKLFVDQQIKSIFEKGRGKGVVVDHFESLTGTIPLLFHGYCDGDHAPFKDVLIIEIVHTDTDVDTLRKDKSYIDRYLSQLWTRHLDKDKVDPILSRVANTVVVIQNVDDDSVKKMCSVA